MSKPRLDEALGSYLLQLAADGRSVHTLGQYRRHVRSFAAWLGADRELDSITTTDVYLGSNLDLEHAPCDQLGLRFSG